MDLKILVVDDSAMSRRTLRRILEEAGYTVVEAIDGISAIEAYFLERPAVVLLDLVMKGMYGLEVLTKLKEMDPDVCVVVASADIQSSTRDISQAEGARGFINKPFTAEQVLDAVSSALIKEGETSGSH